MTSTRDCFMPPFCATASRAPVRKRRHRVERKVTVAGGLQRQLHLAAFRLLRGRRRLGCWRGADLPLAPRVEHREIKPELDRTRIESADQPGVGLELRAITLDFAIEEFLAAAAFVRTGLVVDDPAHAGLVDKRA